MQTHYRIMLLQFSFGNSIHNNQRINQTVRAGFRAPHLLQHGRHPRGPVKFTPVAEHLVVELLLIV